MANPSNLEMDDVVRSVTSNHLPDPTHIGAIDAELLRRVYKDLNECQHTQYNVFAADGVAYGVGEDWNKITQAINADLFRQGSRGVTDWIILKEELSPGLKHGDIVMAIYPHSFVGLAQVDTDRIDEKGSADVKILSPHAHRTREHNLICQHLGNLYKEKGARDIAPSTEARAKPGFRSPFLHEEAYPDLDAKVVVNFHPGCGNIKIFLHGSSEIHRQLSLDEYTKFQGHLKDFVRAHCKEELGKGITGKDPGLTSDKEEDIVEFKAVVAEDPAREYILSASDAHEDRKRYGFPSHTEFSAGVTAMMLLEDQSGYFPCYDALECVDGLGIKDPPIIVEARRANGSVHSRWEFTAFEFDRAVLKDGEPYPTYYLGEKEPLKMEPERPAAGVPCDRESAQKFLHAHVRVIRTGETHGRDR